MILIGLGMPAPIRTITAIKRIGGNLSCCFWAPQQSETGVML